MSGKRKPYVYRPKSTGNGDQFLDRITLGKIVPQMVEADRKNALDNPFISTIQSGYTPSHVPRDIFNPPNPPPNIIQLNPDIKPKPAPNMKWCSVKDHWLDISEFSDMKGTFDGKHPYCKQC